MESKNLYEIIIDSLIEDILCDKYSPDEIICTEHALCEKFGVSRITAKRALEELQRMDVIVRKRGVGVTVNSHAKEKLNKLLKASYDETSNKINNKNTVAIVLPFEINNEGMMTAVRHISEKLYTRQLSIVTFNTGAPETSKQKEILEKLLRENFGGVIFYPMDKKTDMDVVRQFYTNKIPFVVIDKRIDFPFIPCVTSKNFEGSNMITKHLLELGHKKIVWLSRYGIEYSSTTRDRYCGYLSALGEVGIVPDKKTDLLNLYSLYKENSVPGKQYEEFCAEKILELKEAGVTAIQCVSDKEAIQFISICKKIGIDVPSQLNVTGFDDIAETRLYSPMITTVTQDFAVMGDSAAEYIIKQIDDPYGKFDNVYIGVKLRKRESTCDIKLMDV